MYHVKLGLAQNNNSNSSPLAGFTGRSKNGRQGVYSPLILYPYPEFNARFQFENQVALDIGLEEARARVERAHWTLNSKLAIAHSKSSEVNSLEWDIQLKKIDLTRAENDVYAAKVVANQEVANLHKFGERYEVSEAPSSAPASIAGFGGQFTSLLEIK